jgi:hypothetical protein
MSQAEARAWWADVQHLRPDAPAVAEVVAEEPFLDPRDELAPRRRGRITGRSLEETGERRLRRSDAADFARALSLDDDYADERYEDEGATVRTIHITGRPEAVPVPVRRLREVERDRERAPARDRLAGPRPDRVAMYAVALGIFLVLLAAVSSSAQAAGLG